MSIISKQPAGIRLLKILLVLVLPVTNAGAQTFTAKGGALYDYYGYYYRQEFDINVSGLPQAANSRFGLESAMLTIHHPRVSDLKITLQSPDGTSIWLTNRNGKDSGENYIMTRFSQFGKGRLDQRGEGAIHRGLQARWPIGVY